MDRSQTHRLPTPPASAASHVPSTASIGTRTSALPTPRLHRLQPGSQKEIALINYLDDRILKITRRYAKKFSHEGPEKDDTPGYTTYDQFVVDVDPLVDVVWISGTPTIQIPYLLSLAGLACSYLQAFPFSTSVFALTSKIDQGFATLLQPPENGPSSVAIPYHVSMTDKVRIKSLIEETRVAAVNAASGSGHDARIHDLSETETEDDEKDTEEDDEGEDLPQNMSISLGLSRIFKRTLEILGDSLVADVPPQAQDND
ncbi:uncharacterized protein Z519_05571 [Cladophialophora bantiana CBS 173.52]|uniref:Uncharacterized protein n=1 Tax=Cladophialophora bantiana (strain ATCC 10958 / CBS 173.52 / CDC B-1940 / NIH 8579) TaxID=1442370 RepID=A0A0D2HTS1_CLAB1|nr:uncharacterized protein Z519_05571 [Cladophialophora bantiana CBS 173.52]KIW94255.1 hypothetical protein Z519_05571 [Cladophialophora bantiana CBS 173.52]